MTCWRHPSRNSSPDASTSLAVDWTDLESFSRPPPPGAGPAPTPKPPGATARTTCCAAIDELFYGYYLSAAIMMREENGPAVPEFARRATVSSCRHDPVRAFAPVLTAMPAAGIPLGDILDDSGYAHRDAGCLGAPAARRRRPPRPGPAPARPRPQGHPRRRGHQQRQPVLPPAPPARCWSSGRSPAPPPRTCCGLERKTAELARYKLGRLTSDDQDGYHRVQCPAAMGKIRCPLRPASMTLDRDRPEILTPPEHPQACCAQQTITVPPDVLAKTAQKHDYPSAAWRRSYARRTGAERGFATAKDPATNDISRGWCRLMGLAPLMLFTTTLLIVRNQRILHAWNARQEETQRRAAAGLPPKTRKRRRKTLAGLAAGPP